MIETREQYKVQSTMGGDKIAMSVDAGAMAHIMNILTDLYSDPELAIIREYSTNALDAQVEAGVKRPIEVETPSSLSPYFVVRDFGVGLSVDDIHDIYSRYGASTKRGTNDQVGMLGLGCKSALTYASQFTLASTRDGIRCEVSISRDEDGAGSMTVVDTRPVNTPDGTEVRVPAKSANTLSTKAQAFFSYWPKGSVLLNGSEPARFAGLKITDDLYITEDGVSRIVMGNVAYPCTFDWLPNYRTGLTAFVPIGTVAFTPSREALQDTATTRQAKLNIRHEYEKGVGQAMQGALDAASTHADAIAVLARWQPYLPPGGRGMNALTYKGKPVPEKHDNSGNPILMSGMDRYRLGGSSKVREISVLQWPGTVWVYDFVPTQYTANHKRKMLKWCVDSGIDLATVKQFVMLPGKAHRSPWIDQARVASWDTVRQIKLDTNKDGTTRSSGGSPAGIPGAYQCIVGGQMEQHVKGSDLDLTKPIFWMHGSRLAGSRLGNALHLHYPGCTLVCLPSNRIDKFKRDVPQAVHGGVGMKQAYKTWVASLTHDEKVGMVIDRQYGVRLMLQRLGTDRIDDPDLTEAIRAASVDVKAVLAKANTFNRTFDPDIEWKNPLTKYPLYTGQSAGHYRNTMEHIYIYINAVYAAEQENA